ncbi:MAG: acylphosphatase [Candidatus Cloacimonetes bacterium]|jgi:acylphosphatase|nr:acylphosphatase [Candidatus Cloacimonadota bacterium]MCB5286213.1 acylphosphatase [Candidatus Cloacimonadota bacterium]MCK9183896.1 acylphosphatase [Candidatus Cloacimonadota bacterium]MCK9584662.1 acylphosphatase [Candidatus Cloacimonadota bacterium]MDY0228535.1 acylphosphatase [Candidatus Cloacimonadaceae bacterium]
MPQWEILLQGRVQGVGFRYLAREHALRLGVKGNIRNLPDGSVRVIADANEDIMGLFCDFLLLGNVFSRVDNLSTETIDKPKEYNDFEIL